jgi:hypothetical protein
LSDKNIDMDGQFLGGGGIDHAIVEGDVFLKAEHLAVLLGQTGLRMGFHAINVNDESSGVTAHMLLTISEKLYELRSELLKREAEGLVGRMGFDDLNDFLLSENALDLDEDN